MARSAEEVKAAREKVSLVIRILLASPTLAYSFQDVMAKLNEKDYRGAIDAGLVGLVAAVFGKTPLAYSITTMAGLGLGTLIFYYVNGEPLSAEEKDQAAQLASWYYDYEKTLTPSRNVQPPESAIPPRLWKMVNKLYKEMQDNKPKPPKDGKKPASAGPSGPAVASTAAATSGPAEPTAASTAASTAAPAVASTAAASGPAEPTAAQLQRAAGITTPAKKKLSDLL
jgi:hypothetical protein